MTTEQLAEYLEKEPGSGRVMAYLDDAAAELRRLSAIEVAAKNLVKVKGRYHTEQNYKALEAALKETP
jgi:hypothetical protein